MLESNDTNIYFKIMKFWKKLKLEKTNLILCLEKQIN